MNVVVTHGPQETEAFGGRVAKLVRPGWLLGLEGDLGAGKTAFVRGLVRALGSPARVHSPTFSLMNRYAGGRMEVVHLDLYRLTSPEDLVPAGLEEPLLRPEGVTVAEWISRARFDGLPHLRTLQFRWIDENTREISHDLPGL